MPSELRHSLWNALEVELWRARGFSYTDAGTHGVIHLFAASLWMDFFKRPISDKPDTPAKIQAALRRGSVEGNWAGFEHVAWYEVYDFLEATIEVLDDTKLLRYRGPLIARLNQLLERELAAYRIVGRKFVPVTSTEEVAALEEALRDTRFQGVRTHLASAVSLLSHRTNPDYRNSIKESISAVEAMANVVSCKEKATLEDALRALETGGKVHPALSKGFRSMYGYTGDADGIRHALMEESGLTLVDAKFFLLACTSFINYLKAKMP